MTSAELSTLFPGFEAEFVEDLLAHAEFKTAQEGDILVRSGQFIRSTLLVLKGLIKVYREDDEGNEYFMYFLGPGEACALSLVCAMRQRTSEVMIRADGETELLLLPLDKMDRWMSQYRGWYQFVLESYRTRFEELLLTIDQIAFRNLDERLEFYLKRQSEARHSLELNISHQEIAEELNSSREVISRLLKKLAQLGKLTMSRNQIVLSQTFLDA